MAKPELGTKRVCPVTGRKFYDLNKNPVISPYTGEVVPIAPVSARGRPDAKVAPTAAEPERETEEVEGAEFVSLEDADAEAQGKKSDLPDTGDDIDIEDDTGDDDDDSTFIEDEEEGDDDVTDIIGDGIEKDEES
ncbi:TIGR02300 family protein [Pseudorhodoplanes sinuspersici]|uniref:TIGR02300 family protein n=1 Tax=Pseudorhodoplanes sinuspersici TaxID=1235591 RepID=A0A1W6ZQC6_9HYPH|nr:TIGR02300 family protein [Pseudorhodoplanes sinuspersici]ARP99532.1 TIGR02300 family protein [Pseudorhodoplanes sinuspersici]RKE70494.1 uncharacterized protein (TIGR02300 family) [Pseudorhodoplanes sinuspersici]